MTHEQVLRTWPFSQGSDGVVPVTSRRAKRENGGSGGGSPRKHDYFTNRSFGPGRSVKSVMELYQ
jgi:hypothetical protein